MYIMFHIPDTCTCILQLCRTCSCTCDWIIRASVKFCLHLFVHRRAKQYIVPPENNTNSYSLRKKPHSSNKQRGIQVSHWIV